MVTKILAINFLAIKNRFNIVCLVLNITGNYNVTQRHEKVNKTWQHQVILA